MSNALALTNEKPFEYTQKQKEALKICTGQAKYIMLYGGSRSGKTFLIVTIFFLRAFKAPGSNHLFVRKHRVDAINSLWHDTFKDVMRIRFPGVKFKLDNKDFVVKFENGSRIMIIGVDDPGRAEKVLGTKFSTIDFEEASQTGMSVINLLKTRLSEKKGLKPRFFFTCNPPHKTHFTYVTFVLKLRVDTKMPLAKPQDYAYIQMNPSDNVENNADDYLDTLEDMTDRERARFKLGEFLDHIEGAMFDQVWINDFRVSARNLEEVKQLGDVLQIAVAVDPSIKSKSDTDETGIIVVAQVLIKYSKKCEYFVLRDVTPACTATPLEWATIVKNVYEEYRADYVVVEVNQGGDMVSSTLRSAGYFGSVREVHVRHSKHIRAEPIAALYQQGRVHHLTDQQLEKLEECLINYIPLLTEKSPDRLDALVLGLSSFDDNIGNHQIYAQTDYKAAEESMRRYLG